MSLVALIDHAVLQPTQTAADVRDACALCSELGAASVCVKPSMVALARDCLDGAAVVPSTVIGFPHGGTTTAAKVRETETAIADGAREIDMVVNLGWACGGQWSDVEADIAAVVAAAHGGGALVKVIFETGLLPHDDLKIRLCEISQRAGADFVKTSTGFGYLADAQGVLRATGATPHDVALLRAHCGPQVGVKASGGIRSLADAQRFVALGATRLGSSATRAIAEGERGQSAVGAASY